jgi:CheY-like chemotaxis protein
MTGDSKRLNFVLLIDDDDVVNTLHSIILRQSGLVENIRSVMSGREGLSILSSCAEDQWPSIIFVDINMPGMDGWEFIECFNEKFSSYKEKCKICLLSSSLDPRDEEKAGKTELVDFYFSKPLLPEMVKAICKEILVTI